MPMFYNEVLHFLNELVNDYKLKKHLLRDMNFNFIKKVEYKPNNLQKFAVLKLAVNPNNPELLSKYKEHIEKHNNSILFDDYSNAGFDLFVPKDYLFDTPFKTTFIDLEIKTEMVYCNPSNNTLTTCAFTAYPRSSISKTPLMLANHTGIIDSGYRGSLIGAFRSFISTRSSKCRTTANNSNNEYIVDEGTRLLQICHPTLCPIFVMIVDESELSSTERDAGGFGSTGI